MPSNVPGPVLNWTISDVRAWLTELGMARYTKIICDQHKIDGPALLMIQVIKNTQDMAQYLWHSGERLTAASFTIRRVGRHQTPGLSLEFPEVGLGVS